MINVYIAELGAITEAAEWPAGLPGTALEEAWGVTIYSDNIPALRATANPRYQSGQRLIKRTMGAIEKALASGRRVHLTWAPGHTGIPGNEAADRIAAMSTREDSVISTPSWANGTFRSVVMGKLRTRRQEASAHRRWNSGRRLREIDATLPGKHVKLLYDKLTRAEAQVLAQLRIDHSKMRAFLFRIGAVDDDKCECGRGRENTRHFLLHCQRYRHMRDDMITAGDSRYGDISYMLGGRSPIQKSGWIQPGRKSWRMDT
jgi:hypothetical protein